MTLPARFETVEALEDFMSAPSQALVDDLAKVTGDILFFRQRFNTSSDAGERLRSCLGRV